MSLVSIAAAPGKLPAHGKTVCGERLNAMRKPSDLYPAHNMVGMISMTARASERRAGSYDVCTGKTL